MDICRKPYPSDVSDEESALVAPYLALLPEDAGQRAGYDGGKRKKGSKLHMAVDTLGHLIALHVTPASIDDRAEVDRLARTVQAATGDSVELA